MRKLCWRIRHEVFWFIQLTAIMAFMVLQDKTEIHGDPWLS